jgi:hypothetical protein
MPSASGCLCVGLQTPMLLTLFATANSGDILVGMLDRYVYVEQSLSLRRSVQVHISF